MIRRQVYDALQGFTALRMEVLEDMRLGYRVKQAGYAQRVAFGENLLRIRWAESARGILDNLTKNLFAAFRFRTLLLLGACVGLFLLCLVPFLALAISGASRWGGLLALTAMFAMNLRYWKQTRISPIYLALFPVATMLFLLTLMRSMFLVLRRGGVLWRGTLYPLQEPAATRWSTLVIYFRLQRWHVLFKRCCYTGFLSASDVPLMTGRCCARQAVIPPTTLIGLARPDFSMMLAAMLDR